MLRLIAGLGDVTTREASGQYPLLMSSMRFKMAAVASGRRNPGHRCDFVALLRSFFSDSGTDLRPVGGGMTKTSKSTRTGRNLRRTFVVVICVGAAITLFALAALAFDAKYAGAPKSSGADGAVLAAQIAALRKEQKLVGLAAMVMVDGKVLGTAADGERKQGSGVPIELGDRWHLGSITKSITATMIARLIESGRMKWMETVGERFGGGSIHPDWKPVTLRQLLTHTAGAPANFSIAVLLNQPALGPKCTRERRKAVLAVIAEKPAHPPGKKFEYSNVGFTIAAAMAETATGRGWEDLVKREVFEPLGLTEAGFGPPKSPSKTLDQPRGHSQLLLFWKMSADDDDDNTMIMAPAGAVHMTLGNLCTYATDHLRGELGGGKLLTTETYKRLHTPELNNYACGWVKQEPTYDIPHTVYWHNGSNTMWYALVVFIPGKNMVVAVTSNDGDVERAESAAWKVVKACANRFHAEGDAALRKALPFNAFPKKSPFAAVRWRDFDPEVRVGKEWFTLVSLDGIAVGDVVTFCRRTYKDRWQMRFEEDLVEVLFRMGHEPKDAVQLVVRPLGSSETRTLEHVAMTEANRRAIKAAAGADRRAKQKSAAGK